MCISFLYLVTLVAAIKIVLVAHGFFDYLLVVIYLLLAATFRSETK